MSDNNLAAKSRERYLPFLPDTKHSDFLSRMDRLFDSPPSSPLPARLTSSSYPVPCVEEAEAVDKLRVATQQRRLEDHEQTLKQEYDNWRVRVCFNGRTTLLHAYGNQRQEEQQM